jgi:peptidoglycan hydrolase-like protein with peptidoglycan-binding domain
MIPAPAKKLLDFIASKEAPGGYGVVYANRQGRLPKPLVLMTVDQVIADGPRRARDRTGGVKGSSAAGRYQFMQNTLTGLKAQLGLSGSELMTPELQDRLGYQLLVQRGYKRFMLGTLPLKSFGNQIAMEWASFPVLSDINGKHRGQSYYAGDGQNHALVDADDVENVLQSMLSAPATDTLTTVSAPRAATVSADIVPAPWWQRALGLGKRKSVAAKARPGLHPKGSADLWDVQAALKERGYYNTGLLDGLDGSRTQAAVAQIRKDNGLGDGGIDVEFLAGLPNWPHARISTDRATISLSGAEEHAPELFSPPKWLISAGLGSLGLGGASGAGLMDQVQGGVAKANDVFGQVQTAFGLAANAVGFVVEHKTWFLVGIGVFLVWKGVSAVLSAWIKVRQAFF